MYEAVKDQSTDVRSIFTHWEKRQLFLSCWREKQQLGNNWQWREGFSKVQKKAVDTVNEAI